MPAARRFALAAPLAAVLTLGALPAAAAGPVAAGPLTVTSAADTGDGTCDATCTLRDAVAAAAASPGPDTVRFGSAVAGRTITLTQGQLLLSDELLIDGVGSGVTVSGNNTSRVFDVVAGARVEIAGLRIIRGKTLGGGGVRNAGDLTVTAALIENNDSGSGLSPGDGGGLLNAAGGVLTVVNSVVRNNVSGFTSGGSIAGGGISNHGTLTVRASVISANSTFGEGSGLASDGTALLEDSIVDANTNILDVAGIKNAGTMTLRRTTVSNNRATDYVGGIRNAGTLTLEYSTVSGNRSGFTSPGGIQNGGGATLVLSNSTITDNQANGSFGDEGGGLGNSGSATIADSIVAGNREPGSTRSADCAGAITSLGGNLFGAGTGCPAGAGDRTADPDTVAGSVLLALGDAGGLTPTHAPVWSAANPALDLGGNCGPADQRGFPAPVDGPDTDSAAACDAGAVEAGAPVQARVALTASTNPAAVRATAGSIPVTVRIKNLTGRTQTWQVTATSTAPDGTTRTVALPYPVTLAPGQTVSSLRTLALDGPAGLYRVDVTVRASGGSPALGADALAVSKL